MSTSAKLILDMRRSKKDGTYPIALRITHKRTPLYIVYQYSVIPEHWDAEGFYITSDCKKYSNRVRTNNALLKNMIDANKIIEKLADSGELVKLTPMELKNKIINKETKVTFREFTQKIIDELKSANKFGNASVYQQALDFMDRYTDNKDYTFDQITFDVIKHLEAQHLAIKPKSDKKKSDKKNSINSLSFYLRTIRAIYNRAIHVNVAKRENYPFENYSIKSQKTAKRRISKSDIEKIATTQLEEGTNLWHARNYFMFSFYNIGMNFIDIANLKMNNFVNGRIEYVRAKTHRPYSIKLTEPTLKILSFYTEGKKKNDFVFNIIEGESPEEQINSYKNARRAYAKWLKKLANICGIKSNLTAYVARHTWASIAKDMNMPIGVISESLGHEDIKTTQIYLDDFDEDVLDKANQLIIG